MSSRLAFIDLAIILLYVAGTTLLGLRLARRQRDLKSYFVGDRAVNWWLVLVSIVATETSTVTFLSVPGITFGADGNLNFLQLAMGYVVGRIVIAWFLLPQFFRGGLFSAYEVLRQRFSPTVQRVASALFLATRTVADGLRLFLAALLIQQFTGWGLPISVIALGVVTLFYTYLGGMKAVIWTDLIQFVVYIAGAILAGIFILQLIPGGWSEFLRVGSEAHKFDLFDFTPTRTKAYTFWAGLIGGAVFTMASHGADQMMVQRYLCAKSLGEARRALVVSGFLVLLQFLLFLLIGVGLFVLRQQGTLEVEPDMKNDAAFGRFIVTKLPAGLIGLLVAAVLASSMSTLSSSLNSAASAFVSDFYRPLVPGRSEAAYLRVSRFMTAFWGITRMAVALAAYALNSPRSIVDQVLQVAGMTTGLLLGLFVLGSLRRPVSSRAALIGMLAGATAVFGFWLPSNWQPALLAWPWFAPLGAGVTIAVGLTAKLLEPVYGPPHDRKP
ncbi:MAG: sodium:solute symporter [Gemmataceae bacterium]